MTDGELMNERIAAQLTPEEYLRRLNEQLDLMGHLEQQHAAEAEQRRRLAARDPEEPDDRPVD